MARYVQDKKTGKMKGAIGDAKDRVPSASPAPTEPVDTDDGPANSVDTATTKYRQQMKDLAVTTDSELVELDVRLFRADRQVDVALHDLHRQLRHQYRHGGYVETAAETVTEAEQECQDGSVSDVRRRVLTRTLQQYEAARQEVQEVRQRIGELEAVWQQHRWTRAFLVPGGHVHSSMDCSTCNRGGSATDFVRLPQYSGGSEDDIVNDAGERACTVCYPSAPVDVLSRPTRIFSDDERRQLEEAEQRRAQREANRAAKAAKAPTATGDPLVLPVGVATGRDGAQRVRTVELKTERTATSFAVDILVAQRTGRHYLAPYEVDADRYDDTVAAICDSIAEKRGVTRDVILAEWEPKVVRKVREWD